MVMRQDRFWRRALVIYSAVFSVFSFQSLAAEVPSQKAAELSRERVDREIKQASEAKKNRPVAEAFSVVQETRTAANLIQQNSLELAKSSLERTLGKLDLLLSSHRDLALVPVSVDLQVVDTVLSDSTVKEMAREVKSLVNQGHYQPARLMIHDMASEIDLVTLNLPLVSYPSAIRNASRLLDQGKPIEARTELLSALQSLVVVESVIPIPLIRAEALVGEVGREVDERKLDRVQASKLLTEADRQLELARDLGYGNRKEDFENIRTSIASLEKTIKQNQDSKGLLSRVKQDLKSLKEKTFRVS